MGRVLRGHGLRGEVVVALLTNREERMSPGAELWAGDRRLRILTSRPFQTRRLVRFEGVDDREAADALRGAVLCAEPLADAEELWVHELIGAEVAEQDGTRRGRVTAVQANPASDLLVLESGALVPLTFVVAVEAGRIVIDPPPGLFEL
ncbi:MAG: ribosome maturation factor RimM [Acidimicrobiales bacterium]